MVNITDDERGERVLADRALWRTERDSLKREVLKLRREVRTAYSDGYKKGSGWAFARLYGASPNDSIRAFISQLSMSATVRKPPFGLTPDQNRDVRAAVTALVEKMEWEDEWCEVNEHTLPL